MDRKRETVETYNRAALAYATKFNTIGGRADDVARTFSFVAKQNPFVFEIGCGNGRDAQEILLRTNRYLGIDISEEMVRLAREQRPEGVFEVGDIENYSLPRDIDVVFAFASLLHVSKDSLRDIFGRLYEALTPEGIVFVSLKNMPHAEAPVTDEHGVRTFYWYTPQDIKELTAGKYEVLYEHEGYIGKQKWLEMILQKR